MTTETFTYSKVFKNIKPEVVQATKDMVKAGIWKADVSDQDKAIAIGLWIQKCAEIYNFEAPKFYFVTGQEGAREYARTGGGCYFPHSNEMYLFKKVSITTLLHEFRHAMQFQKAVKMFRNDHEEDARAWSVSLYRKSLPNSYKKAVEKGILHFQ
jgi:hypothetical protein